MFSFLSSCWPFRYFLQTTKRPPAKDEDMATLYIPETLLTWPWPRAVNPHYEEVAAASLDWLHSYNFFPHKAQLSFDRCNYGLLASMAYPKLNKEHVRIGCDLMNVFFVIEAGTDDASPEETQHRVNLVMDALRNPTVPRPDNEWHGAEIARDFWHRATTTPGVRASTAARFLHHFEGYLQSVATEAADRAKEAVDGPPVYSLESFLEVRRRTVGAQPSFVLLELGLPESVTDEELTAAESRPDIREVSSLATDMILIGNDLVSYNRERATGAVHNIVTVVLKNPPPGPRPPGAPSQIRTVQDSVDWVAAYHQVLLERFLAVYERCQNKNGTPPTSAAALLASGLGNWVRANDQWSFESVRYFGARGAEVQASRRVALEPLVEFASAQ